MRAVCTACALVARSGCCLQVCCVASAQAPASAYRARCDCVLLHASACALALASAVALVCVSVVSLSVSVSVSVSVCVCVYVLRWCLLGNATKFLKPFKVGEYKQKVIYVHFDENSLAARRDRASGTAVFHQLQQMKLLTRWPLNIPTKQRRHYTGSNKGDCMGPVCLPEWGKSWSANYDTKVEIYGRTHRIAVGGATEDDEGEDEGEDALAEVDANKPGGDRPGDGREPIFYHSLPVEFYEDLYTSNGIKYIVHLSSGDGSAAKAAMRLRRGYLGFCMTEVHMDKLYAYLTDWMLEQMADANSPYYESDMAVDKPATSEKPEKPKKGEKPSSKKGDKPKPGEKKKGGKKRKRDASSSSSSSGSSQDSGQSK